MVSTIIDNCSRVSVHECQPYLEYDALFIELAERLTMVPAMIVNDATVPTIHFCRKIIQNLSFIESL